MTTGSVPSRPAGGFPRGALLAASLLASCLAPAAVFAAPPLFVAGFSPSNQVPGLSGPVQVGATAGFIFALDGGRVVVRGREYPYAAVASYGETGDGEGFFFRDPRGMALNAAGDVLAVADTGNDRVQLFAVDGGALSFLRSFGSASPADAPPPDGTFRAPGAVAFTPSGDLLVADSGNKRVQHFDSLGRHLATYPSAAGNATITGVCADEGDLGYWVATQGGGGSVSHRAYDAAAPDVVIETRSGAFSDVKVLAGGYVAACDNISSRVVVYPAAGAPAPVCELGADGPSGPSGPSLFGPRGIFVSAAENRVFVADKGHGRIAWYELAGYSPPPAPPEAAAPDVVYPDGGAPAVAGIAPASTSTNRVECSRRNVAAEGELVTDVAVAGRLLFVLSRHGPGATGVSPDAIEVYDRAAPDAAISRHEQFADGDATFALSSPESIAADPAGGLLAVADTYRDRVLLFGFDASGAAVSFRLAISNVTLSASSSTNPAAISPSLRRPGAVAFTPSGDLLVADRGNSRVLRLAAGGYSSAEGYLVGGGRSTLEDVCHDSVGGQEGFWFADSLKSAPARVAFQPFGSASPSLVIPAAFDHPSAVSAWGDGVTNRLAVLDKGASALYLVQCLPQVPEARLCAVLGSAYSTNSSAGPGRSAGRLLRNASMWTASESGGTTSYVPDKVLDDRSFPKLQNPGGLAVGVAGGTNVFYVADTGNSRVVWYGVTIDGTESAAARPPAPAARTVAWPFASIAVDPADAPGASCRLGWELPGTAAAGGGDFAFRIDRASDIRGPWDEGFAVKLCAPGDASGGLAIDLGRLDPSRNFFTLWWTNSPVAVP